MIFLLQRAAFVLALRKAFFAVYRPIVSWLERNFAFFLALRANCLEHLPIPSKTTALVSHFFLLLILQMFRTRGRRPWLRRKLHGFSPQFPPFLFLGLLFPGYLLLVFFVRIIVSGHRTLLALSLLFVRRACAIKMDMAIGLVVIDAQNILAFREFTYPSFMRRLGLFHVGIPPSCAIHRMLRLRRIQSFTIVWPMRRKNAFLKRRRVNKTREL